LHLAEIVKKNVREYQLYAQCVSVSTLAPKVGIDYSVPSDKTVPKLELHALPKQEQRQTLFMMYQALKSSCEQNSLCPQFAWHANLNLVTVCVGSKESPNSHPICLYAIVCIKPMF
jgi:hypothetical protein